MKNELCLILYTTRGVSVTYIGELSPLTPITPLGFIYKSLSPCMIWNHHIMAYGSSRRYSRRRRPARRTTRYRRRVTRRPRRTTVPRRMMSRRRILNITSEKKQDSMISYFQPATGSGVIGSGVVLSGAATFYGVWCATARDLTSGGNVPGNQSLRESDNTYMRGLKERINFVSNTGASWRWRRICITRKGSWFSIPTELEVSPQGWTRYIYDWTNSSVNLSILQTDLFQGAVGQDWSDPMTAKVDTDRQTLMYDRVTTMSSGNASGKYFQKKLWHPMNKRLLYSNDEAGDGMSPDIKSTTGRAGMGDYYVIDIIDCATGNSADTLRFNPEATLYWHEK